MGRNIYFFSSNRTISMRDKNRKHYEGRQYPLLAIALTRNNEIHELLDP